jgi:hypothetical protein
MTDKTDILLEALQWLRSDHERCNPWLADTIDALFAALAGVERGKQSMTTRCTFMRK